MGPEWRVGRRRVRYSETWRWTLTFSLAVDSVLQEWFCRRRDSKYHKEYPVWLRIDRRKANASD